jgi:acetate kinase
MVPQVACFDTAFHGHMPAIAKRYPLPRHVVGPEVMRYGFHGLSYESVVRQLEMIDPRAANSRLIIAHLGNGASMVAVRGGVSVETTMGFTPTGGLIMGTRSGDLDPGVLLYLLETCAISPDALNQLVNREAGLLGVSGTSADVRDLLDREAADARAAEAIELFCYQARKFIGALVAVLGGLDTLVFTGGIGEHAAPIRQRICAGFGFLGITLDPRRNAAGESIISQPGSTVSVRVIGTDEDGVIARHTARLVQERGGTRVSV